jgi:hypothetical protein
MAPHTRPYRIILSILFISYTVIRINNTPSSVHAHTFQLSRPSNTPHLSSMSYPADYGDDPLPSFICANNDSDDEDEYDRVGVGYNNSDAEAACGGVWYGRHRLDKNMPEKGAAPINLMRNMESKFFNWGYTLPFNTASRAEDKPL